MLEEASDVWALNNKIIRCELVDSAKTFSPLLECSQGLHRVASDVIDTMVSEFAQNLKCTHTPDPGDADRVVTPTQHGDKNELVTSQTCKVTLSS